MRPAAGLSHPAPPSQGSIPYSRSKRHDYAPPLVCFCFILFLNSHLLSPLFFKPKCSGTTTPFSSLGAVAAAPAATTPILSGAATPPPLFKLEHHTSTHPLPPLQIRAQWQQLYFVLCIIINNRNIIYVLSSSKPAGYPPQVRVWVYLQV